MFVREKTKKRVPVGTQYEEVIEFPNLIDIQLSSYERFLQLEALREGKPLESQGLQAVFESVFPIESTNGELSLEYHGYSIDEKSMEFSEAECKYRGLIIEYR